jgi:hypothetical protein
MFLGVKGGLSNVSHGHMDVGSFVLESDGVRWVEDLGAENYNLPGYFSAGAERWKFFRLSNHSHNTLVIGGKLQDMTASTSPLVDFESNPDGGYATIDMSSAYAGQADKILRRADFNRSNNCISLTDTITGPLESVRWAVVTQADIEIKGSTAILKRNGKSLKVIRNDKHGGTWEVRDARPTTSEENQNKGYRILSFTAPAAENLELSVTFEPEK